MIAVWKVDWGWIVVALTWGIAIGVWLEGVIARSDLPPLSEPGDRVNRRKPTGGQDDD